MAAIKKRVWLKDQKQNREHRTPSDGPSMSSAVDYDRADPAWSCNRKKVYPDESFASRVARRMWVERDANVVAYACRHCGNWHIGRAPG